MNKQLAATVDGATSKKGIFRWAATVAVVVLAALGLWEWAWLVLAVAAFHDVGDIGVAIAINQLSANALAAKAVETKR
jgi:hypothetical protein